MQQLKSPDFKLDLHAVMMEIVCVVSVGQHLVAEHQSLTRNHCILPAKRTLQSPGPYLLGVKPIQSLTELWHAGLWWCHQVVPSGLR